MFKFLFVIILQVSMWSMLLVAGALLLIAYIWLSRNIPLSNIPGPQGKIWFGNAFQLDKLKPHIQFANWAKKYGGIFKITLFNKSIVIVNDLESIHNVLMANDDFAGRPQTFRFLLISDNGAGIAFTDDVPEMRNRRKIAHWYLKQYGSGISKIEELTQAAIMNLINRIREQNNKPLDASMYIYRCVTDVMTVIVFGTTIDDQTAETIKKVIDKFMQVAGNHISGVMLDSFPFLRYFGNSCYTAINNWKHERQQLVQEFRALRHTDGFINHIEMMPDNKKEKYSINQQSSTNIAWELMTGGISTSVATISFLVNVLSQMPELQQRLQAEVLHVTGSQRLPCLQDKNNMPLHQATILEINRYGTMGPISIPHKAIKDTMLGGYQIPKDTEVWYNLWALHHDEEIWGDPYNFRPDRFLDDQGQLLPADHFLRKHLMSFGAGARVCLGQVLAMSRMFLILASLMQTFTVLPETTIDNQPSMDPREMTIGLVLQLLNYKVCFQPIRHG